MTFKRVVFVCTLATAWIAIVALYALNGLGPRGYIRDETEAWLTVVGWLCIGGVVLGWILRRHWFDAGPTRSGISPSVLQNPDEGDPFPDQARHYEDSEERRYARGQWTVYDSDECDFGR